MVLVALVAVAMVPLVAVLMGQRTRVAVPVLGEALTPSLLGALAALVSLFFLYLHKQ